MEPILTNHTTKYSYRLLIYVNLCRLYLSYTKTILH